MSTETTSPVERLWKPLNRLQRRVLGVLIEKAKTTPDNYPLSLNALVTGCNQKSNRSPKMDVAADDVEETLESLQTMRATAEVHGDGRVIRYRHYAKDWLGVDGSELAVIAELLLRGTQTIGELRGRAARMAHGQLPDMTSLRPVLQSLVEKELVVQVTPPGRGQLVTHGLYSADELQRILNEQGSGSPASGSVAAAPPETAAATVATSHAVSGSATSTVSNHEDGEVAQLRREVESLREELARVKKDVADLWSNLS